jgi:DNA (cytosine-5)-methyltransferase 1
MASVDAAEEHIHEHMPVEVEEPVLLVPPREVPVVWGLLTEARCVPQFWQLGGRFGGRIRHVDGEERRGIPLLPEVARCISDSGPACSKHCEYIRTGIECGQMAVRSLKPLPSKRVPRTEGGGDATVHKERRRQFKLPCLVPSGSKPASTSPTFTFVELFAGIGGFRQGLEALGGKCLFASEIDTDCCRSYARNYGDLPSGDIRRIPSSFIPDHDMLVGGFPCQPFSREGLQPGLAEKNGNGLLFLEIVRILRDKQPKAFFLENVPGLLYCDEGRTIAVVMEALELEGTYAVRHEVINARCLTAQSRNRLYFVGMKRSKKRTRQHEEHADDEEAEMVFAFPFIPDLGLRFADVLESDEEIFAGSQGRITAADYTLSEAQFQKVHDSRLWSSCGPNGRLAWAGKVCETLISNYGHCVGNGSSMLVPRAWPHNPRRYTARECARLMGFPDDNFDLGAVPEAASDGSGYPATNVWFKAHYRMLGNAVCPPLICAVAGAILQQCPGIAGEYSADRARWEDVGLAAGLQLAIRAVAPSRRQPLIDRLTEGDRTM